MLSNNISIWINLMRYLMMLLQTQEPPIYYPNKYKTKVYKNLSASTQNLIEKTAKNILKQNQQKHQFNYFNITINSGIIILEYLIFPLLAIIHFLANLYSPCFQTGNLEGNIYIGAILGARALLILLYIANFKCRWRLQYFIIKLCQFISIFLIRDPITIPIIILQYLADIVYIFTKNQQCKCFDSRPTHLSYFKRITIVQICVLSFSIDSPVTTNNSNLFITLIGACLSYIFLKSDHLFNLVLKRIQEYFNMIIILYIGYLLALDIEQTDKTNIQLLVIQLLTPALILLVIFGYLLYAHKHLEPLKKKYLNLQFKMLTQQDKIKYIWQSINLLQISHYQENSDQLQNQFRQLCLINMNENLGDTQYISNKTLENQKKLQKMQEKFPQGNFSEIYRNIVVNLISKQAKDCQYFRLLEIFYGEKFSQKKLEQPIYDILSNSQNLQYAFYEIRETKKAQNREFNAKNMQNLVMECKRIQFQIKNYAIQYATLFAELINCISSETINLHQCSAKANQLYALQHKFQEYGVIYQKQQLTLSQFQNSQVDPLIKVNTLTPVSILNINLIMFGLSGIKCSTLKNNKFEFIDEQKPVIVLSGDHNTLGTIVSVNNSVCRLTNYTYQQLIGQNINLLLPQQIIPKHNLILERASLKDVNIIKQLETLAYIINKTKHCVVCQLQIKSFNSLEGKKWVISLRQMNQQILLVYDKEGKIIGYNQKASYTFNTDQQELSTLLRKDSLFMKEVLQNKQVCFFVRNKTTGRNSNYSMKLINEPQNLQHFGLPQFYIMNIKKYEQVNHQNKTILENPICSPNLQFQFRFDIKTCCFTNQQPPDQFFQKEIEDYYNQNIQVQDKNSSFALHNNINYGEDIQELIYIDGEIQFRENKTLSEKPISETYPPHLESMTKKRAHLIDSNFSIPQKETLIQIMMKACTCIRTPMKIIVVCKILLIGSFILFLALQFNFLSRFGVKKQNHMKTYGMIHKILYEYSELSLYFSQGVWHRIGAPEMYIDMKADQLVQITSHIMSQVEQLQQQIQEINFIFLSIFKNSQPKIPYLNQTDNLGRIQENFKISLADLLYNWKKLTQDQFNLYLSSLFQEITLKIIPVYKQGLKILIASQNQFEEQIKQANKILIVAFSCFFLFLTLLLLRLYLYLNSCRLKSFESFDSFYQPHLNYFLNYLKEVIYALKRQEADTLSIKDFNDLNNEQFEREQTLFHYKRKINKSRIVDGWATLILNLFIRVFLATLVVVSYLGIYLSINDLESAHYFQEYYLDGTQNLNQIWFNKILLLMQETSGSWNSISELELNSKINYLIFQHTQNIRISSNKIHKYSIKNGYSENFVHFINNILQGDFCTVIKILRNQSNPDGSCKNIFFGYTLENIQNYIPIKNRIILEHYDQQAKQFKRNNHQEFANFNKQIIQVIQGYEQFIFDDIKDQISEHIAKQYKNIEFKMTCIIVSFSFILLVVLGKHIYKIKEQNKYIYEPLLIITKIFPNFLLDKNWRYKKFYEKIGIKMINQNT